MTDQYGIGAETHSAQDDDDTTPTSGGAAGSVVAQLLLSGLIPMSFVLLPAILVIVGVVLLVVVLVGDHESKMAQDFSYQCDSALGRDPSVTVTAPSRAADGSATAPDDDMDLADLPTANPYAELTVDQTADNVSDRQRHCIAAMKSAPYQLPARQSRNAGFAAQCAYELALDQVGKQVTTGAGTPDGPTNGAFSPEAMSRYVVYKASMAANTRVCREPAANAEGRPVAGAEAARCITSTAGGPTSTAPAAPKVVLLPNTVAGQALCGQRVDPAAISAGDLVFWDYRRDAPTRVGVALTGERLVTDDPNTGRFALMPIPIGDDIRVKRVLDSGG